MPTISPKLASELALEIYGIQNAKLAKKFLKRPEFIDINGKSNTQSLTAEVGFRLINTQDSFGLCAEGGKGYEQHIFIIFRGSTKLKADWMSNARIGLQPSTSGWPVHIGFNTAFKSMLPQIREFLGDASKTATINCIGHSLGGAVATLAANWIANNTSQPVKLYTFGAPKPGLMLFANSFTRKLGKKNIFRVYNATDPVPMVPLFPYVQPPLPGFGHFVASSEGIPAFDAHDMFRYAKFVSELDWRQLERRKPPYTIESSVKNWLESKARVHAGTPKIWEWINSALIYVLTKVVGVAIGTLQVALMGAFTLADTIAWALQRGIEFSKKSGIADVSKWVLLLMNKIMQALGMGIPDPSIDFTQAFMRNVLDKLIRRTNEEARKVVAGT